MRFLLRFVVVLLAVVGAASLLNPSADAHRAKLKAAVAERSALASLLRLGDLTAFASRYHSLVVASYTTVDDEWVTVGAFGVVWVRSPSESAP
jgi:hypothetical protein